MKILKGHISAEIAYLVDDYPYGFRLRCKIRYWLEVDKNKGVRFCSQTSNPKITSQLVWNKPKKSTYSRYGGCMFLDENGHVKWDGLTEYSDYQEAYNFREKYNEGIPDAIRENLDNWIEAKRRYEAIEVGIEMRTEGYKI